MMIKILSDIAQWTESFISHGGYLILFLFTALEGIPLFGMLVPGHVAIIMAGFLAKIHTLNIWFVLLFSVLGAVLGDFMGYYLGRKYGIRFIERLGPFFLISKEYIEKARQLLQKHTGKTLIVGRFTPATRSLMPFLVGTNESSVQSFWLFNIIGGVSWVFVSVMTGYIFGAAYSAASEYIGKAILISLICAILIIWCYKFVNSRFHVFRKYELFTLILNVLSLWSIAFILDKLTSDIFKLGFDVWVNGFMDKINHLYIFLPKIAKLISDIFDTKLLILASIILTLYLLYKKRIRSSLISASAIIIASVTTFLVKNLLLIERPLNLLDKSQIDPSFPSGHATLSATFFMVLVYIFSPRIKSWILREGFIVLSILLVFIIGVSRLIINVHWLSDVLAGWALGIFITSSVILLVRYLSLIISRRK